MYKDNNNAENYLYFVIFNKKFKLLAINQQNFILILFFFYSNKGKGRREGCPEDDGDYATLRELPLVTAHDDDNTSEENKVSFNSQKYFLPEYYYYPADFLYKIFDDCHIYFVFIWNFPYNI